jgi:hypothetical protein
MRWRGHEVSRPGSLSEKPSESALIIALALLAIALPAPLVRLRLAPGRSLTARLMFRGRRGRRLFGPRLLLAATALSARTWRALLVSRGHGALLLPWRGGPLWRGHGASRLPWHRRLLLLSRRYGTLVLARNGALRWRRRPLG